jgi:AcrR family transcriptional regulator
MARAATVGAGAPSRQARKRARQAAPDDRRGLILSVARRHFATFGYKATTIRDIAKEAHLLPGSIYHHFGTKEEILREAIRADAERLVDGASRIAAAPADAETRLVSMIVFYLRELTTNYEGHAILYNERRLISHTPGLAEFAHDRTLLFSAWRQVLEDGVAKGLFRPDAHDFLVIFNIIRSLYGTADWIAADDATQLSDAYSFEQVSSTQCRLMLAWARRSERIDAPIPPSQLEEILGVPSRGGSGAGRMDQATTGKRSTRPSSRR